MARLSLRPEEAPCSSLFFVAFYGADVVNGSLSSQNMYWNNSNAGLQNVSGGGTISTGGWVSNHAGTINLGTATNPFTGTLIVSGSFNVGFGTCPFSGFARGIGTAGPGGTIVQTGGTVELTGGGDLVTMGFNGADAYKLQGGFLSIPNTNFELGVAQTPPASR